VVAEAVNEEQTWLLRAVLVLVSPRPVFAALRDDSDEAAHARSQAVLALVLLAGIALVLWTPTYGRLLQDRFVAWDGFTIAVLALIGGGIYGIAVYWAAGLLLYLVARGLGLTRSYRQVRHVLAFAAAPVALSLFLVWPVRLAVYGDDVFRVGGSDRGAGNSAFVVLEAVFVVWALVLLAIGIRVVFSKAASSSSGIS
jgi:Yip1 domain